ncbi:MAG: VWA domain-containing protein [Flavobacteriia bacterium]|nr:VWA domain-containing protein [Flavobacteriia bacterium]
MNIVWAHPEWLHGLWGIPVLIAVWVIHDLWSQGARKQLGTPELQADWLSRRSSWRIFARNLFGILALTSGVIALANPQKDGEEIEVEKKGLDIVFAIDMSRSMLARDVSPSRLEQAKQFVKNIVEESSGDRIGFMAFSSDAYKQLPLTLDHSAAQLILNNMNPDHLPSSGSNFESVLLMAPKMFDSRVTQDKALVIISDGEDHSDSWRDALEYAVDSGIYVFTAGVGTEEGSPIPSTNGSDYHRDNDGEVVITKRNDNVMKEIADEGRGTFFDANRGSESDRLLEELKQLKLAEFGLSPMSDMEDQFQIPLAIGMLFLLLRMLLTERSSNTLERWMRNT